jgi:hypothetical protein
MHKLSNAAQVLIAGLRGSTAPELADAIEVHLRLGKIETFRRGVQDNSSSIEEREKAAFTRPPNDSMTRVETDEDKSKPYSSAEQIEESLKLISTFMEEQAAMADDAQVIVRNSFKLDRVSLLIEDVDGGEIEVSHPDRRKALNQWKSLEPEIRKWLKSLNIGT